MLFLTFVVILATRICWNHVGALTYNPAFPTGQCLTLPSDLNYRLINPCAGVVDYQYFSFATLTPQFLEAEAKSLLSSQLLLQLGQTELNNLVRLTCSNLYLKCFEGVVPSDPTSYNYDIYQSALSVHFGVPFYRPCISVCTPFTTQTQVNILLTVIGSLPSCTGEFDYSYTSNSSLKISTYDTNVTDATQGKCFVPSTRNFSAATQPYVNNGGPCDGFVGSTYFTPFGNIFNSSYAVIQSDGIPRYLLDAAVESNIPKFPPFVTGECRKAFKQYVCYSAYFNPVQVTLYEVIIENEISLQSLPQSLSTLVSYSLTLPQYPAYDVCTNFVQQCAAILSGVSINCTAKSATSSVGARAFPEKSQVVAAVALSSLGVTLTVSTSPNSNGTYNATADTTSYATSCPTGFVVPDDPNNDEVQWVTGTACALACKGGPPWTQAQWHSYIKAANSFPIAGTIFGMLTLIYILYTKIWEENYLMLAYTIVALVASTQAWNFVEYGGFEDRMCVDNAVNIMQNHRHVGPCITQGVILHYSIMSCSAILLCMAVERLFVHHKLTELTRHPVYLLTQLLLAFFYPIIPVVIVAASDAYGYSKTEGVCWILSSSFGPDNLDTGLGGLTVFITWAFAFVIMILSRLYLWEVWVPLCPTKETSGKWKSPYHGVTYMDALRGIDPYFAVIWASTIPYVVYFAIWGQTQLYEDDWNRSAASWIACVFSSWDGSTDSSWEYACGKQPNNHPSTLANPYLTFVLTANMIVIGTVFVIFHAFHHYINEPEKRYNALPSSSKKSHYTDTESSKREVGSSVSVKSTSGVELIVHDGEELTA